MHKITNWTKIIKVMKKKELSPQLSPLNIILIFVLLLEPELDVVSPPVAAMDKILSRVDFPSF